VQKGEKGGPRVSERYRGKWKDRRSVKKVNRTGGTSRKVRVRSKGEKEGGKSSGMKKEKSASGGGQLGIIEE